METFHDAINFEAAQNIVYAIWIKAFGFFCFTVKTHKAILKNQVVFFMFVGGQNILNPVMPL